MRCAASVLFAILIAAPAYSQDFTCRNEQAEISCDAGACELNGSFTPMSLSRNGAKLSICAYSGCAEGPVLTRRSRGDIDYLYGDVRWLSPEGRASGPGEPLAIIYNRTTKSAQMHWRAYMNTTSCGG